MTTCADKILCENAFGCNITLLDTEGNPVDPLKLNGGEDIVFVLGEKPGYYFRGWIDEDGNHYQYAPLGDNRYLIHNIDCNKQYIAKYCAIQYTVKAESNSDCFNNWATQAYYGDIIQIIAHDSVKCRFLNWTKNGALYSEAHSFEYVVTENATFVANYDSIKYRITAKPDKFNRGVCTGSGIYDYNSNVQISATEYTGYRFDGWEDGITERTRTVNVRGNKTYKAIFGIQENNIYIPQVPGGSAIGAGSYPTGNIVSLQALPQPGWVFSHWTIDEQTFTSKSVSFVSDKDVTAMPYFDRGTYNISFVASPNGQGYFNPSPSVSYSYGDTFTIEAIPFNGYSFVKWSDGLIQPKRNITVFGDAKYTALFARIDVSYQLVVVMPSTLYDCTIYVGHETVGQKNQNQIVTYAIGGTQVTLAPIIPEGKKLVSLTDGDGNVVWSGEATSRETSILIPYTIGNSNTELILGYEEETLTVGLTVAPINADTSGEIPVTATIGSTYDIFRPTLLNPTRDYADVAFGCLASLSVPLSVNGYTFSYWYTDDNSYTTPTINLILNKNLKCVAVYSA